jgi:xanthine permease XanP
MTVKPSNLLYDVNEVPPLWAILLLGLQHVGIFAISLILPVVVIKEAGLGLEHATRLVSISMIAAGIGSVFQALRRGPVGSGYLCPQVCGPSYLSASILAAKTGGVSLLFGMTFLAGTFEAAFSRLLRRLRFLFPAEVTGLIVAMVGITVTKIAVGMFFGVGTDSATLREEEVLVACATLALMVGLNVWSRGQLRLFCIVIGMAAGYALSAVTGILGPAELRHVLDSDWAYLPLAGHPGWSFRTEMILPFVIAMLCSSLKSVGDLTTCQKINDARWKRPDMDNISRGILADAIGAMSSGLLGGMGQSTSSSNVGLSIATGATSRVIAYAIGGLLLLLAFCPKLAAVFAIMPQPVMGATLVFALSFMVMAGLQIIMSRMIDARKTFVVGISLLLALGVDMVPEVVQAFPGWSQPIFSSSLSTAAVAAVLLNLVFRIGIAARAGIELTPGPAVSQQLYDFMERQGGQWGARREVIDKATAAMDEFMESAARQKLTGGPVAMEVRFDEFNLDVDIHYRGRSIEFPDQHPTPRELIEDPYAIDRVAGYLVRRYADKVSASRHDDQCRVRLHFEH